MPKWSAQAPEQTALYAQIRASRQPCSASEPPATTARARGDYATALTYLEQSLAISREIGDARGLCATLFNTSHIYAQNEQIEEALGAWVAVYQLASRIGEAQALAALEDLAGQIGLPDGLAGWAALAGRMGEG